MNEITFVVNGDPIGKMRHRSTVLPNGMIHNYNSKKNTNYENLVKSEYKRQYRGIYFTGELEVIINAYFAIPKSWSKKKKQAALNGEIRPQTKPDCDNVSKIILDSLNQVAFDDDKQITDLHTHKYYSDIPRCEITIIGEWLRV